LLEHLHQLGVDEFIAAGRVLFEQLIAGEVVVGKAVLGDHINATDRP